MPTYVATSALWVPQCFTAACRGRSRVGCERKEKPPTQLLTKGEERPEDVALESLVEIDEAEDADAGVVEFGEWTRASFHSSRFAGSARRR